MYITYYFITDDQNIPGMSITLRLTNIPYIYKSREKVDQCVLKSYVAVLKVNLSMVTVCPNGSRNKSLQWRHNEHDGVSDHQSHYCLLNRLFRRISKRTSKLRVTGLCAGNSPVIG